MARCQTESEVGGPPLGCLLVSSGDGTPEKGLVKGDDRVRTRIPVAPSGCPVQSRRRPRSRRQASLDWHPCIHHLEIFVELGEDEASAGGDRLAGFQTAGDDDKIAVLLGDRDLSPARTVSALGPRACFTKTYSFPLITTRASRGITVCPFTGGISRTTLTSMSDLSFPPRLGIDARTRTARVSREDLAGDVLDRPVSGLLEEGEADLHLLAHGHLGLIHLVDVGQHPEMVKGSDHHQHVVLVVEVALNDLARDHDAVNLRDRRVIFALSATLSSCSGLGTSPRLAINGSISASGTPVPEGSGRAVGVVQAALALVVLGINEVLLGNRIVGHEFLLELEQTEVVPPLHRSCR